ncbi:MAG: DUF4359 domain-containing protein [Prevotella sp.]|jgi:hypothetical protein|nr:DUF4359 domain-containing protein [Prevotella sp.]
MRDIKEIERRYNQSRGPQKGKVRIKKWYVIALVLLIAIITNPGVEKHKEAVRDKIYDLTDVAILSDKVKGLDPKALGDPVLDQMIYTSVSSSNFILFSLTEATWNDKSYVVGIGAFTKVFLFSDVDEVLTKQLMGTN